MLSSITCELAQNLGNVFRDSFGHESKRVEHGRTLPKDRFPTLPPAPCPMSRVLAPTINPTPKGVRVSATNV